MNGSAIRAAVLLPPRDVLPAVGREVAALLSAYVAELGDGRRIDLVFGDQEGSPAARAEAAREFVRKEEPLALVATFTDGADAELAAVADEMHVPLLATLSSNPRSSIAPSRWLRDLCGGVVEQARALVRSVESKSVALLHTDNAIALRVEGVHPFNANHTSARDLAGFDAVLFAGAEPAMLRLFEEMEIWPTLLLAGAALPPSLFDRVHPPNGVWVALPASARDESPAALAKYLDLVQRHGIPTEHRFSQLAALTSLQLFLDALGRCGHDAGREPLLHAVDDTRAFHSGFLPRLSYGEGRHIGSTGAWVVPVHKAPAGGAVWVD
jgi:hypothetical protein